MALMQTFYESCQDVAGMPPSPAMLSGAPGDDVWGKLHFYVPPEDGSEPVFITDSTGSGTKNYTHEGHLVLVRDIRPRRDHFSLAEYSFAAVTNLAPLQGPIEDEAHEWRFQTEKVLLDSIPGGKKVIIFDYLVRRAEPEEILSRPVRKVHIDQTPQAAWQRVFQYLSPADYNMLAAGRLRFRIINLWRSINQTVIDHPLVFADSLTLVLSHLAIPSYTRLRPTPIGVVTETCVER
jgi:hypothetical protein